MTIPLGVTVVLGSAFPALVLLPMTSLLGVGLVIRTLVAIAASCALLITAVQLSRPLVDAAARL